MAEISRADAITIIRCIVIDILGENAKGWESELTERTYYALGRAISDMEKLQKIEQIIEYGDSKCEECDVYCEYFPVLDNYCEELKKYDLIEQIVKEQE